MDVSVKMPLVPEFMQGLVNQLHGMIGVIQNARAQKQPLDVIPAVKFNGEIDQFGYRECCPRDIVAPAIDAVGTVVPAIVGQHDLQQRNTTSVFGKAVTNPQPAALPIAPALCPRDVPLEAQDTSYLADSANIFNLFKTDSSIVSQRKNFLVRKQIENS